MSIWNPGGPDFHYEQQRPHTQRTQVVKDKVRNLIGIHKTDLLKSLELAQMLPDNSDLIPPELICDTYNKDFANFTLISYYGKDYRREDWYKIRFNLTGYETVRPITAIKSGQVEDYLIPKMFGIGCLGEIYDPYKYPTNSIDKELRHELFKVWKEHVKSYSKIADYFNMKSKKYLNFTNFYFDIIKAAGFDRDLFIAGAIGINHFNVGDDIDELPIELRWTGDVIRKRFFYWENTDTGESGYSNNMTAIAKQNNISPNAIKQNLNKKGANIKNLYIRLCTPSEIKEHFT